VTESLPLLAALVGAWVALVGAVIGSFLNVVIGRLPAGESVIHPRSRCPRCGTPIAWYDNVPIVSWILLRARCRACRAPISWRYPLVEALIAAAAWLAWWRQGLSAPAAVEFAFVALLVTLSFIDLDTWLLPHVLTFPTIALGLGASALGLTPAGGFAASAWGAGIGFAIFAAVSIVGERVFRRPALGFGDVWLLAGIGAFLGAQGLLPVILLGSSQGAVVGLVLLGLGRMPRDPEKAAAEAAPEPAAAAAVAADAAPADASAPAPAPQDHAVPFGPFLVLAALEWLYLADLVVRLFPPLAAFA
jgi:leader peptidase (prepilin peptidase)/N-methyltransferase